MKKSFFKVAGSVLIGWFLYSFTATVPMNMAFPLPDAFHTNMSSLPTLGYTDKNALVYNLDQECVPKGAIDRLSLFENSNSYQSARYDPEQKSIYVYMGDGTYKFTTADMKNDELYSKSLGGLAVRVGNYEYVVGEGRLSPDMVTRRGLNYGMTRWEWTSAVNIGDDVYPDRVVKALSRQKKGKITARELAAILQLRYSGQLIGWFPEKNTAVLNLDGHFASLYVGDDGEASGHKYIDRELLFAEAVSDDEIIGYDKAARAVVDIRISSGEQKLLVRDMSAPLGMNVMKADGKLFVGGLSDEHTVFIYRMTEGDFTSIDLGDDFNADKFICDGTDFFVFSKPEGGEFRWKRGTYNIA